MLRKKYQNAKFGIPTTNDKNMLQKQFSRTEARDQGHSDLETVRDTLQP